MLTLNNHSLTLEHDSGQCLFYFLFRFLFSVCVNFDLTSYSEILGKSRILIIHNQSVQVKNTVDFEQKTKQKIK